MSAETYTFLHTMYSGILPETYTLAGVVGRKTDDTVWVITEIEILPANEDNDDFDARARITCRPADVAETAAFRERMQVARARNAIRRQIIALKGACLVLSRALKPERPNVQGRCYKLPGESLITLFVDTEAACLWHVQANGDDGDNWSRNNAPGAIVHRFEITPQITEMLNLIDALETAKLEVSGSVGLREGVER